MQDSQAVPKDAAIIHQQLSQTNIVDPASRADIVRLCKALAYELEDPVSRGWDWMGSFCVNPALCILADLNIFEILKAGPKSSSELAEATGADALLICMCRLPYMFSCY